MDSALDLLVTSYPQLVQDYGLQFELSASSWALLLARLLASPHPSAAASYQSLLTRLTSRFTPAQFLTLLPPDGALDYYIPFIKQCILTEK